MTNERMDKWRDAAPTPAPWVVKGEGIDSPYGAVLGVGGFAKLSDLRLAACAPELLQALCGLMGAFDACAMIYDRDHEAAYIAAREAVRRAQGVIALTEH